MLKQQSTLYVVLRMLAFREHPKRIGVSTQNNTILCNQVRTKILSALKWETLTFKRSMFPILRLKIYKVMFL